MIISGVGSVVGASLAVGVMFAFGFLSVTPVALLTVLALALMIMAFVGAYCAFTRRWFRLALAGGICSAMALPFIPGLVATIFITVRESEFHGRARQEPSAEAESTDGSQDW